MIKVKINAPVGLVSKKPKGVSRIRSESGADSFVNFDPFLKKQKIVSPAMMRDGDQMMAFVAIGFEKANPKKPASGRKARNL
tara:strand:- start:20 stop:265 length:246 start_codon:yes stop_codon:yes gene_type:complete